MVIIINTECYGRKIVAIKYFAILTSPSHEELGAGFISLSLCFGPFTFLVNCLCADEAQSLELMHFRERFKAHLKDLIGHVCTRPH